MSSGKKLTYEEVKNYFEANDCTLLETEYKNARTKMKYRCTCGNISEIVLYSFKNGNRCQECGKKKISQRFHYSQEQASDKFAAIGCELIGKYKNAATKCKFRCHCGNIDEAIPNNIWRRKQCNKCGLKNRSGSNHYMWYEDREEFETRYTFKQRSYKLLKMALKVTGRVKNKKTAKLLGYDYKQLQEHITSHENWSNLKNEDWHIDHIFPIKAFLDYGISDLKLINALDNLQPLAANDNLCKNAKYNRTEFEKYLNNKGIDYETPDNGV